MKTKLQLIIAATTCCASLNAQFTLLDQWHGPKAGTSQIFTSYDSTTAMPRNTGASQTWNFSSIVLGSSPNMSSEDFKAPSSTPAASLFPAATLIGQDGSSSFTFYNADASKLEIIGESFNNQTTNYTNTLTLMKWPFSFGNSFTDTFASSEGTTSAVGESTVTASGYGNVMLPGNHTYTNCMQVLTVQNVTVTETAGPYNGTVRMYTYYSESLRYPILQLTDVIIDGDLIFTDIQIGDQVITGINEANFQNSIGVYPNPATDQLNINIANQKNESCTVQINDLTGKLISTTAHGSATHIADRIDIRALTPGLYFVTTQLGDQKSVQKIIVE